MKTTERELDFKLTTDTPYLALMGELLGVCGEDFGENQPRYNGTALYLKFMGKYKIPVRNDIQSKKISHRILQCLMSNFNDQKPQF